MNELEISLPKQGQYQHYIQKAYLKKWALNGGFYVFNTRTRKLVASFNQESLIWQPGDVLGRYDWQSHDMETAFQEIETEVGYINHTGTFEDNNKMRIFATWVALHRVRNGNNLHNITGIDYRARVESLRDWILKQYTTFQDFLEPVLITSDNPIMLNRHPDGDFMVAVLSPQRCAYIIWDERLPGIKGQKGMFQPRNINMGIVNTSATYCVSFDEQLHLP